MSRLAVGNLLLTASTATYRVPGALRNRITSTDFRWDSRRHADRAHLSTGRQYSFRIRVRGAAIGLAAANLQGEEIEISLDGERITLVPATATIDLGCR